MRTGTSRIIGIRVGEASIDLIHHADAVIKAEFALIREDGAACGKVTKVQGWSDQTGEALRMLLEAMEADMFSDVFQGPAGPPESETEGEKQNEPKQF